MPLAEDDPAGQARIAAFLQGLQPAAIGKAQIHFKSGA
jgi:hypothetical protein